MKNLIVIAMTLSISTPAWTCASPPQYIELAGSTFTENKMYIDNSFGEVSLGMDGDVLKFIESKECWVVAPSTDCLDGKAQQVEITSETTKGKVNGIIKIQGRTLHVYSVKSDGSIDPYGSKLEIWPVSDPQKDGMRVVTTSYKNQKKVGEYESFSSKKDMRTRSMSPARGSALQLAGKDISSSGSGCASQVKSQDFKSSSSDNGPSGGLN